jgi:hypothetical protein
MIPLSLGEIAAVVGGAVEGDSAVTVTAPAVLDAASLSKWRLELRGLASGAMLLNDSFNANPDSARAALDALAAIEGGRRIAVLGGMLELGDDSEAEHRRRSARQGLPRGAPRRGRRRARVAWRGAVPLPSLPRRGAAGEPGSGDAESPSSPPARRASITPGAPGTRRAGGPGSLRRVPA